MGIILEWEERKKKKKRKMKTLTYIYSLQYLPVEMAS